MVKNENGFSLVGVGEVLWDLLPGGKLLGGAPANFAYHAMSLGGKGYVVSCVGDDEPGYELLNELDQMGLNRQFVALDHQHPTGTVSVSIDAWGAPEFIIQEDVAWDYIPFSPKLLGLVARVNAVCFGSLAQRSGVSCATIRTLLQSTPSDCLRVFDVNLRKPYYNASIIKETLQLTDVLKLNDQELKVVAHMCAIRGTEYEIITKLLEQYNLEIIALTKGGEGSLLYNRERSSYCEAPFVNVVDTVGAGDAFTAALIMGMLQKLPLETLHENATKLSAYVCTKKGATPELPLDLTKEIMTA